MPSDESWTCDAFDFETEEYSIRLIEMIWEFKIQTLNQTNRTFFKSKMNATAKFETSKRQQTLRFAPTYPVCNR